VYQVLGGVFYHRLAKWGFVIFGKRMRGRFINMIFEDFEVFYGLLECNLGCSSDWRRRRGGGEGEGEGGGK